MDRSFIFEDFSLLSGQQLKSVLENVDSSVLAKSLKGARKDILEIFLGALDKKSAVMLEEDIEYMGPVRIVDVEEAQEKMIKAAFDVLAQDGKLTLSDGQTCVNDFSLDDLSPKMKPCSFVDKDGLSYEFDFSSMNGLAAEEQEKVLSCFSAEDVFVANRYMGLSLNYFVTRRTKSCLEKKHITVDSAKVSECQEKIVKKMVDLISSGEIKNPLTVEFCDLICISDRDTQKVLREADEEIIVMALKSAADEVKDKVFRNMSKRQADSLKSQIEALNCTDAQTKDAQKKIVGIIRRLEESGELIIARGWISDFI